MKTSLWVVILVVLAFLGFMMGYALPPFLEVGFGQGGGALEGGPATEEELMKQYEELYEGEEPDSASE